MNDNNDTNNKNNGSKTDFSALVPDAPRAAPKNPIRSALGQLKEQMAKKNTPPTNRRRERDPAGPPARQGENRQGQQRYEQRGDRNQRPNRDQRDNRNARGNFPRNSGGQRNQPIQFQQSRNNRGNFKTQVMPDSSQGAGVFQAPVWVPGVPIKDTATKQPQGTLKILPIGGINDVQKNMYVYEYENDIVIIDCGIGFADEDMPGVDFLIPDISYLQDKKDKVRAILHTHGHDDHIGALPFIWPQLKVPVYASRLTAGFIKNKMTEHNQPIDQINEIDADGVLELGVFKFQFFRLSHSIPDTLGFVIDTPVGRIIHSADFKFDWTPVLGVPTDVQRIAQFGAEGVLLLLSDSLGAEKPGYTLSETVIDSQFDSVVEKTNGKVIITTTSSNISRIQLALNIAQKRGRKVAVSGRSMDQNISVARNLGYLRYSDDIFVPLEEISRYDSHELMLLVAGSQGQPESALGRIANDEHKFIRLQPNDAVVFSTDPIPGNENQANRLIDMLIARGAEVYYSHVFSNLHVSGHAAQEELKLMIGLVRPQYLLPIGGTERSTKKYSEIAQGMRYQAQQVLLPNGGEIIEIGADGGRVVPRTNGTFETRDIMVDGLGIGDLSEVVIRDRQVLSEEGILIVIVPVNRKTGHAETGVEIVSRGFVYMKESLDLINNITQLVDDILQEQVGKPYEWAFLRKKIEDRLSKYIFKEIQRKPMILPVVFEI